jgi:hypothetical protein
MAPALPILMLAALAALPTAAGCNHGAAVTPRAGQAPAGGAQPAAGNPAAGSPAGGPAIPATPAAPAGEWSPPPGRPVLQVQMAGRQIYKAEVGTDKKLKWTPVGTYAELLDSRKEILMRYYRDTGDPVWEDADGSAVVGKVTHERPSPNPGAVPELQVDVHSVAGPGVLSTVRRVDRLNTFGGSPPADPGPPNYPAGVEITVIFRADYLFYAE